MSDLRPIAVPGMLNATPATQVLPLLLIAIATAGFDDQGAPLPLEFQSSATFTFPAVASGTVWQGTLSCTTAPDQYGNVEGPPDTAVFTPATNADQFPVFSGRNTRGPIQLVSNNQLTVNAVGLIPGRQYVMSFIGTQVVNGIPQVVAPEPYAESVTDSTEQIFLAQTTVGDDGTIIVKTQRLWRALWVVTLSGQVPALQGVQSELTYAPVSPPYLAPLDAARFYRFPIIYGLDTQVILTFADADTVWYGADLTDVDAAVYSPGGGGLISVTSYTSDSFAIMGTLVLGVDPTTDVPPFFAHVGAGQTTTYTGIYAATLTGEITADIQQNGSTIPGLSGITITDTPTLFTPTDPITVADLDAFSVLIYGLTDSAAGLTVSFQRTDVM